MKKWLILLGALVCVLSLVACDKRSMNYIIANEPDIVGIVKDINDNSILIENNNGEYWVSLNVENADSMTTFSIGDEVVVYYDGNIAESYPMQINTVYAIILRTPANRIENNNNVAKDNINLQNQGVSEPESYTFEAQYIRTDGYSGGIYPYHVVINSKEELEAYYEANKELFDLERKEKVYSDTTIGFLNACDKYDEAYFEQQNLVLIVMEESSGSNRHEITDVRPHRGETDASQGWDISINRIVPEAGTEDMAHWHLFLEIQMGNIINDEDNVWINEKPSHNITDK